ncbi:MAG TPA: glycosyltransferase family 2 protein [bacterium]|nr:glycosyltransferase family 2 protein [bacterium]
MRVSMLLPVYNEQARIAGCLDALAAQTMPRDAFEILIADGGSTDATRRLVAEYAAQHPDLQLRLLDNPLRSTAAGLNVAVRAATGAVLARVDGHSVVPPHYLSELEKTLTEPGVWAAGAAVVNADPAAATVWAAMTSPFGCGGSDYRTPGTVREVASVQAAAYRREVIDRVGQFDETMQHAEDDEYNWRVTQAGGRIILRGDLQLGYYPRRTGAELARQMYNYGRGRVRMLKKHPRYLRVKHLVPALFVLVWYPAVLALALVVLLAAGGRLPLWWALLPAVPLAAYGVVHLLAVMRAGLRERAMVAEFQRCLLAIHTGYGCGFIRQLFARN